MLRTFFHTKYANVATFTSWYARNLADGDPLVSVLYLMPFCGSRWGAVVERMFLKIYSLGSGSLFGSGRRFGSGS